MKIELIHNCDLLRTTWNDLLGEYESTISKELPCRVIYKVNKIIDKQGEENISNIKFILSSKYKISPNDKIRYENNDYTIKSLEPKQDLNGKVDYLVIHV